jgi:hypothetical protein
MQTKHHLIFLRAAMTLLLCVITSATAWADEVTDHWGGAEADGTAAHPYIISDKAGWDLLIEKSKTAGYTDGKYFELAADISGVTKSVSTFGGHLDGKEHKVTLETDKSSFCYGLIQYITAASTISNLTVDGTMSNTFWMVGGFVQQADAPVTFTNCRCSVDITSYSQESNSFRGGGFIGVTGSQECVFDRCVFDGSFTSDATLGFYPWIGGNYPSTYTNCAYIYGGNAGFRNGSTDARAYTLTLTEPATVVRNGSTAIGNGAGTAYTDGFSYGGGEYHTVGSTVTLCPPAGISIAAATYNGLAATINTDGTARFAMPAANTTAAITGLTAKYIDADGAQQTHAVTLIGSSSGHVTLEGGWYAVTGDVTISQGLTFTGAAHLILTDDATLTVNDRYSGEYTHIAIDATELSIYGQALGTGTLHAYSSNYEVPDANVSSYAYAIKASGSVTLCGGCVNATATGMNITMVQRPGYVNCYGINAEGNNITVIRGRLYSIANLESNAVSAYLHCITAADVILDWRHPNDRITLGVAGDTPSVRIANGKTLYNGKEMIHGTISTAKFNNKTLQPAFVFEDFSDNTSSIANAANTVAANPVAVQLKDRTLYKDGDWNTLCLPFDLALEGSPLENATLMELDVDGTYSGHQTGFDASTGTLYLFFKTATNIQAGTPYIIKWGKADNYENDNAHNIVSPIFTGVTIDNSTEAQAHLTVASEDANVRFIGSYDPVLFTPKDKSNLFLGAENTLFYPTVGKVLVDNVSKYRIGSFRAYFQLSDGTLAREFKLNFGDGEAQGISDAMRLNDKGEMINDKEAGAWYTLDGVKFDGKPTRKGLYINNGVKVVIK